MCAITLPQTIQKPDNLVQSKPCIKVEKQKQSISTPKIIGIGSSLVALSATGIYIAKHRGATKSAEEVFNHLKNGINNDTTTFMEVLKNSKIAPKNFKKLLFKITEDESLGGKFVEELTKNPRNSKNNTRILSNKIGGDSELLDWMHQPNGYQQSYTKHIEKLYSNPETTIDDLMKTSPNWNVWKLKEKFGENFSIGEPPKEFGNIEEYRNSFFPIVDSNNNSYKDLKLGNYINGGLSGKGVRLIETNNKKYILKFQVSDFTHENKDIKDNLSMHSDSALLNTQTERFLDLNGYTQGPKLKFFDYKTNSSIYELSEGTKPQNYNDILKANSDLGELNNIGIYYNDVQDGNFLVQNNKTNFIDSGESSFVDFFKPGVTGYHFSSPNLNGKSITDSAAAIMLSKNK